jgi:hypothetical protein
MRLPRPLPTEQTDDAIRASTSSRSRRHGHPAMLEEWADVFAVV